MFRVPGGYGDPSAKNPDTLSKEDVFVHVAGWKWPFFFKVFFCKRKWVIATFQPRLLNVKVSRKQSPKNRTFKLPTWAAQLPWTLVFDDAFLPKVGKNASVMCCVTEKAKTKGTCVSFDRIFGHPLFWEIFLRHSRVRWPPLLTIFFLEKNTIFLKYCFWVNLYTHSIHV